MDRPPDAPPDLLELIDAWEELGVWPPRSPLEELELLRSPDTTADVAILRER